MIGRWLFAHALLWRSDALYRRAWYVAPQLAAVVTAGWLLTSGGSGPIEEPGPVAGNWGAPVPQKELSSAADALRDRAKTDAGAFESLRRQADLGDMYMQFAVGTLYDSTLSLSKLVAPDMKEALKYYRAAAEQGHIIAAYNCGAALVLGHGVPRDVTAGLPWLLKAANANFPPAGKLVGIVYRDGNGVPPDKPLSLKWFRQAADRGDIYSTAEIGAAYWDGAPPYSKDPAQAVQWFLKAAADPKMVNPALNLGFYLGMAYRDGTGVAPDKALSLKWFREAAEKGNTYAAAEIGAAYWDGAPSYAKDPAAAVQWFLKAAADPGEVYAARMLGVAYRDGTGAPPDKVVSLKWFRQAADKGDTYAAAEIGAAYWDGAPSYAKDPAAAVQWFLKAAADPGEGYAARMLGFAYRDGDGVPPDKTTSLKWFRQAADRGDTAGAAEIGAAYWDGTPPYAKDAAQAVQWYIKAAADPAEINAARTLGVAYRDGVGVPADRAVSLKWFRQAADRGDSYAAAEIGAAYWDGAPSYAKDPAAAVQWFLKAAADPVEVYAARMLGFAYRDGVGVPPDKTMSLKWFRQAADRGDAAGAAEVGAAYSDGTPPYAKDAAQAVQWYIKAAADPAEINAARTLGVAYRDGVGVQADRAASLKWFRQAANRGDTYAAAEIGFAYWNGTPPYPVDNVAAVQWLLIAAASPTETQAQLDLGVAYRDGRGVERDPNKARYWFGQAALHGDNTAAELARSVR